MGCRVRVDTSTARKMEGSSVSQIMRRVELSRPEADPSPDLLSRPSKISDPIHMINTGKKYQGINP